MDYEKSCGAIIYRYKEEELQVLLIQQSPGRHWCFPKGHVEKDETEEETAIREIQEEVGLNIKINKGFRHVTSYLVAAQVIKKVVYFAAEALNEDINIQEKEILNAKWLTIPKALETITYSNDKKTLEKFYNYYKRMVKK